MLLCREHSINRMQRRAKILKNSMNLAVNENEKRIMCHDHLESRNKELGLLHTHILYYIMEFMVRMLLSIFFYLFTRVLKKCLVLALGLVS